MVTMKKDTCIISGGKSCGMKLHHSFLFLITMIIISANFGLAQPCYKEDTKYLLKEVDPSAPYFFKRYKLGQIGSYYLNFYVIDEKTLLEFFNNDSIKWEQTILLCDPGIAMFSDSAISREVRLYTRIKDILVLDDTEIYEIGGKKYFIRKIRYAYYDNSKVKVYTKGFNYYFWDDISEDEEDILNATYEVGQLYKRDYYQCYHHLIELLPTSPLISKHLWRRLYQFGGDQNKK